ncbi:hypothetical protein D3C85_685010 [compost metagenome]
MEKILDVCGDARHLPIGGQSEQETDRLDGSRDVDRFAIAIGQIDRGGGRRHFRSAPG